MTNRADMFVRQRRGLNTVSIGLIVFFLAGGPFEEITFSVFGIPLENNIMAAALIWVAFAYFLYRFNISGVEARQEWELERTRALKIPSLIEGTKLLSPVYVEKFLFKRYLNDGGIAPLDHFKTLPRHRPTLGRDRHNQENWERVSYWKMLLPELIADIKALREPGFSESVLPLLLAYSAISLGLVKWIL